MLSTKLRPRGAIVSVAACAVVMSVFSAPAWGATDVYPAGGGAFGAGAEGWQEEEASCTVSLLSTCTASAEHDAASGNPAGSMTAKTNADLNLLGTLESTIVFESPQFTITDAGAATLHLDREFVPGGLIELVPEATYVVSLVDDTAESESVLLNETIEGASAFTGKDAAATVVAGHSYTISVEVKTTSTVILNLLIEGETDVRFDNVALSVQTADDEGDPGDDGEDGKDGKDGSSADSTLNTQTLLTSVRRSTPASASLRGKHVFVRATCPRRIGGTCRIVLQGRIKKKVPVTQRRAIRIAKGKSRVVGLRVKRRFRDRVAKRKRLLIVQKVRVGKVTATFARSRALIKR